jgi:hypothetical protein
VKPHPWGMEVCELVRHQYQAIMRTSSQCKIDQQALTMIYSDINRNVYNSVERCTRAQTRTPIAFSDIFKVIGLDIYSLKMSYWQAKQ